ncbi:Galactan beta-1,4-galactosyltransferase GALS1 [Citrus sinensis]|uniref:Galactan beta-1,4-galactosyltransferase GALS1 n=1 Tax=Citrus sinensis TaxID=2711 RepID=A0ACB8KZG1_CITSI|nr:Galactan beta-1,4-galactosyltransferase GALS1 [Citrus sinensis]
MAYHAWSFGTSTHFVFHDVGWWHGVTAEVRAVLDPWLEARRATLQDIRTVLCLNDRTTHLKIIPDLARDKDSLLIYYHYHNTITVHEEVCGELVPPSPSANQYPYVLEHIMKKLANTIKQFEHKTIGSIGDVPLISRCMMPTISC